MKQTLFSLLLSLALFSSMAFAQSGTWSPFQACSVGCGGGTATRNCILNGQQVDFSNCPGGADASTAPCNTVPCGTIIGVWSAIHACDAQCMTYRDCIVDGAIADNSYCEGESVQVCTIPPCNNVSFPGVWSDFSNCTREDNTTCGAGVETRDCLVNGTVSNYTDCEGGEDAATRNCSTCTGTWSDWLGCTVDDDATCGTGYQTRDCLVDDIISDLINCEGGADAANRTCPPCTGTWSDWSNCTVDDDGSDNTTCGTGYQTRDCLVNGTVSNFTYCEGGEDASNRTCPACPGTWSDWSNCSAACGAGIETRDCLVNGTVSNFTDCEGGEDASVRDCTGTDCEFVGVWGEFHACNASCGGGVTYRDCLVNGTIQRNNSLCEGGDAAATRECNTVPCGTIIGTWSAFHACNASCGGGSTYRDCLVNGSISDPSYCEGNSTAACNTQPCESSSSTGVASSSTGEIVFAGVWSNVHACPVSCGGGTTYRDCLVDGQQADYSNCEGESTRPCNTQAC